MKNYFLPILFLLLFFSNSFSQIKPEDSSLKTYEKISFGINGLGISVETPLSHKILSEFYIGVGPSYKMEDYYTSGPDKGSITQRMQWAWYLLEPSFHASVYEKFYYNREKRFNKNKSVLLNAGNFIGLKVKYVSKTLSQPQLYANTLLANLNWGIQRNLGKHWTYSFSTGLGFGYNMDQPYTMFYPALDLQISYVLPFFDKK